MKEDSVDINAPLLRNMSLHLSRILQIDESQGVEGMLYNYIDETKGPAGDTPSLQMNEVLG